MKNDDGDAASSAIVERSLDYSLQIIRLARELDKDLVGRALARQLLRAGTSIGANVHEAQGGQSRADFIAKMSIAHKEARETLYWLRLIKRAELLPAAAVHALLDETSQIIRIVSSILLTSKGRLRVE